MTESKLKKAEEIKNHIEKYEKAIKVFDINEHVYVGGSIDKKKALDNAKKPFGCILECFKRKNINDEDVNALRLSVKGFFGGEAVEVDMEFIEMCLKYFVDKKEKLEKQFEEL